MRIKDIVNREIVNLTNCEHEPIHIPGSIQPHGFLVAVDCVTFQIQFCSANVLDFLDLTPADVLSKHVSELFNTELVEYLTSALNGVSPSVHPQRVTVNGRKFDALIHKSGEKFIFECEPALVDDEHLADIYDQTSRFLSYMNQTSTLKGLCEKVAKGTREITGYDRVMIYHFDKDYNGEIIAEDVRDDLEPFLGLHYPHTDIPSQARELYLKNLLRLIYDVNYDPVPIFTQESNVNAQLDLSHSILRSTSPIHVKYLHNMGVGATLTISLIHKGKLWGLIACHHYSPKNLPHKVRLAAQLQGHFITSQIEVRQLNEEYEISKAVNQSLENLSSIKLGAIEADFHLLTQSPDLIKICNASAAVILYNKKIYKTGNLPADEYILSIADKIVKHSQSSFYSTDKLISLIPDLKSFCQNIAGVVYYELSPMGSNCIIWFRGESVAEVNWAGDPTKAIIKDTNGLSPRNSFKLYREIIKCVSKPWLEPELNAAANFAHILQKHANFLTLSQEKRKYRQLSEVLKDTNLELENINWISTHDLQEPLRKMQLSSSRLLSKEQNSLSTDVVKSLVGINKSASKMQNLLVDILSYTRINQDEDISLDVDLNLIMKTVLFNVQNKVANLNVEISVNKLPCVKGSETLILQVFSNLISNSLTFVSKDSASQITIFSETGVLNLGALEIDARKFHIISIVDNGIGFDNQFSQSIFNVFTKAHNQDEFASSGSGIGLAVVKKIMQIHNGMVTAEGSSNGASFHLYFPI